jgi:hypothetical protein
MKFATCFLKNYFAILKFRSGNTVILLKELKKNKCLFSFFLKHADTPLVI